MISEQQLSLIRKYRNHSVKDLAFKWTSMPSSERQFLLQQIHGYQKAKEKLPIWAEHELLFPPAINLEQCSSQQAAKLKLDLLEGNTLADLTGGFGVDATIAALSGKEAWHVEPNIELQEIAKANAATLLVSDKMRFVNATAERFLADNTTFFDTILIDPSRRDEHERKMVGLHDCVPIIPELLPTLALQTSCLVLKLSPMLDIHKAVEELSQHGWHIKQIRVISIKNECKELVFKLVKTQSVHITLELWNVTSNLNIQTFSTVWPIEPCDFQFSESDSYVYDPHTSIHKAQAYAPLATYFNLQKAAPYTHLFCSKAYHADFPGKIYQLLEVLPYKKESFSDKANIIPRNFPDSEPTIRKKTGIPPGDTFTVFAIRNVRNKPILWVCKPL